MEKNTKQGFRELRDKKLFFRDRKMYDERNGKYLNVTGVHFACTYDFNAILLLVPETKRNGNISCNILLLRGTPKRHRKRQ